ncbi:MAG: DNA methyltransferase [Hydrogenophilales bacterium 16-64-40]|nr:MAG: DNA methyltransferase [Hydrogenophilales bacterium 16-64-40]
MTTATIVQKLWNYCNVLRDDGMSYGDYVEQLTYLLFLKMADERSRPPYSQASPVPAGYDWPSLVADVKGDAYEGLLEKNAQDTKSGAGQYFTPRPLIQAIVDAMAPTPKETISDPACGTGGFLLAAHDYVVKHYPNMTSAEKKKLRGESFKGWELVQATARLCAMNMLLHGIGSQEFEPIAVGDSLAADPGERFDVVLTNPPFGKKSSTTIVGEEGKVSKERDTVERDDFWATTSNKQLNFVQHVKTLLKQNGRAALVLPDNVLFEGGAGETIRRKLLHDCDVHTLLRLPTGLFYAQGVKANVVFFDKKPAAETPWTRKLWIYDLRTNMHFTLKTSTLKRADLDEFVKCYHPENRHVRKPTWSQDNPDGRWREYDYEDLINRDKASLDIFWLRDESLSDSDNLPAPEVIAAEIVEDLEAALEQFREILADMDGTSIEVQGA